MRHIWSIEISLVIRKMVIKPIPKSKLTLKQLLVRINKENLHHEVDTGSPIGNETW
jgi:antitoxin component of MazEF toxin-antitoxin module